MVVNTPKGQGARRPMLHPRATTGADRPIITTVQQLQAVVQALEASCAGLPGSQPPGTHRRSPIRRGSAPGLRPAWELDDPTSLCHSRRSLARAWRPTRTHRPWIGHPGLLGPEVWRTPPRAYGTSPRERSTRWVGASPQINRSPPSSSATAAPASRSGGDWQLRNIGTLSVSDVSAATSGSTMTTGYAQYLSTWCRIAPLHRSLPTQDTVHGSRTGAGQWASVFV